MKGSIDRRISVDAGTDESVVQFFGWSVVGFRFFEK